MTALTDISSDIDSVFDEMKCVVPGKRIPHGDNRAAIIDWHGCLDGMICRAHYNFLLSDVLPLVEADLRIHGVARCGYCKKLFRSRDDFVRVYPL